MFAFTMGLHHFYWQGKERTVSVDRRRKEVIKLRFIDPEIIEMISEHRIEWQELEKLGARHPAMRDLIVGVSELIKDVNQR